MKNLKIGEIPSPDKPAPELSKEQIDKAIGTVRDIRRLQEDIQPTGDWKCSMCDKPCPFPMMCSDECNKKFNERIDSTQPTGDWEKEFDKLLAPDGDTINSILESRGIYDCGKCFKKDEEEEYLIPIKSFIRKLLTTERKKVIKVIKEIEGRFKDLIIADPNDEIYGQWDLGYSKAVIDLIAHLKSNLK